MKNQKNWMMLAAILAGGATVLMPAAQAKDAKTEAGEVKSEQTVSLDGQSVVVNGVTYKLSGAVKVRFSVKQKSDGAQIKLSYNAAGASVTAPDGTVFRLVGASNTQVRTDADGATFKSGANFGLVGKGKAPNFRLKVNLRGSVSPTGVVTLDKSDFELR